MPTYTFRCRRCGVFDLNAPMSRRPERAACPVCGGDGRRTFTAPRLHTTGRTLDVAVERAGRSAESPQVVRSIPPGSAGPRRPGPLQVSARDPRRPPLPRS